MNKAQFPIDSLPSIIKNAINEVQQNTKAPLPLIATSALSIISLACQQKFDIIRYDGAHIPVSLFFITLAESGERKTTIDKLFMKSISQLEEYFNQQYEKEMFSHRQDKSIFDIKKKALSKKIATECRKGNDVSDVEAQLKELLNSEPKEPIQYKLCFNDATPAAIKDYLSKGWNSVGIMSDEAGVIFEGHALNELGFINKMWDGGSFLVSRKSDGERHIQGGRMTLSLMSQPQIFYGFLQKKGDKVKDIGFLARCLICRPISTQGTRLIESTTLFSAHLDQFHQRIKKILSDSINDYQQGIREKTALRFSPEAEQKWIAHYNAIELTLKESGNLYHYKEFGSKIAENIARLAALIHIFSSDEKLISIDCVNSAYIIADWFFKEQQELFPLKDDISEITQDAEELFQWINDYLNKKFLFRIAKTTILQYGPNKFRNASRLNILINILDDHRIISLVKEGKTTYITTYTPLKINANIFLPTESVDTTRSIMDIIGESNRGVPDLTINDSDCFLS